MQRLVKNSGLQLIVTTMLTYLDKSDIASFRLVNQDCKNIVVAAIFSLKKLSLLKDVPNNLIKSWKKIIQNLQHANNAEIKQEIGKELLKMFCTTDA